VKKNLNAESRTDANLININLKQAYFILSWIGSVHYVILDADCRGRCSEDIGKTRWEVGRGGGGNQITPLKSFDMNKSTIEKRFETKSNR
jgi:hypothetical protein